MIKKILKSILSRFIIKKYCAVKYQTEENNSPRKEFKYKGDSLLEKLICLDCGKEIIGDPYYIPINEPAIDKKNPVKLILCETCYYKYREIIGTSDLFFKVAVLRSRLFEYRAKKALDYLHEHYGPNGEPNINLS